ncbi:MAG: choice-of-anchor L domain-containing protein [Myxococcota bacterium]
MATGVLTIGIAGCSARNPAYDPDIDALDEPSSASTDTGPREDERENTESGGRGPGEPGDSSGDGSDDSVGGSSDDGSIDTTGFQSCACEEVVPCFDGDPSSATPFEAIGVGCEDNPVFESSIFASAGALEVLGGLGASDAFAPRQGGSILAMGTGTIDRLLDPLIDCAEGQSLARNQTLGKALPAPIIPFDAGGDCLADPSLVGFGDCSNTLQTQFNGGAYDYGELRFSATVPGGASGIELDYAFLISEYPDFIGPDWNDMFMVWLDSELWTGNIALDSQGNPLAVDTVYLEYRDDDSTLPELAGTCMEGHGATAWLTGAGPVEEGEEITVVVSIWDGRDIEFDAYALVDGFRWVCGACP